MVCMVVAGGHDLLLGGVLPVVQRTAGSPQLTIAVRVKRIGCFGGSGVKASGRGTVTLSHSRRGPLTSRTTPYQGTPKGGRKPDRKSKRHKKKRRSSCGGGTSG